MRLSIEHALCYAYSKLWPTHIQWDQLNVCVCVLWSYASDWAASTVTKGCPSAAISKAWLPVMKYQSHSEHCSYHSKVAWGFWTACLSMAAIDIPSTWTLQQKYPHSYGKPFSLSNSNCHPKLMFSASRNVWGWHCVWHTGVAGIVLPLPGLSMWTWRFSVW